MEHQVVTENMWLFYNNVEDAIDTDSWCISSLGTIDTALMNSQKKVAELKKQQEEKADK